MRAPGHWGLRVPALFPLAVLVLAGGPVAGAWGDAGADDGQRASQRLQYQVATAAIANGSSFTRRELEEALGDYPLIPYLEHRQLRRDVRTLGPDAALAFLDREAGTALGQQFRREYLAELARRGDWRRFLAVDDPAVAATPELRCQRFSALLATGRAGEVREGLREVWATGQSLPTACDAPISTGRREGWLGPGEIQGRLGLAADAGNGSLAAYLAGLLPEAKRTAGERLARAVQDPEATLRAAAGWPNRSAEREAVARALRRQARAKVDVALGHWERLEPRFRFSDEQRTAILHDLALYAAAAYRPDAGDWFRQVPREARSEALGEWELRAALAQGDWKAVLEAATGLPATLGAAPRPRYWQGRSLEQLDRKAEAREVFGTLAREAHFHGFLAADRLEAPYSLCPREVPADDARTRELRQIPDVARALELYAIGWRSDASRAFDLARARLGDRDRRLLLALASEQGWHDRVVFGLSGSEDLEHYALRFPIARRDTVEREARANGLDPALAFALIRAESAWQPDARSPANAYGLMQILPTTGQRVARELGIPWQGTGTLLQPETNIQLGTRYLASQARRFGGSPWLAAAAYNAGPTPVARWLEQRRQLPADAFIETIPYRETREYVARVLAFSVIYDWRLGGVARPLSSRLPDPGRPWQGPTRETRPVVCARA